MISILVYGRREHCIASFVFMLIQSQHVAGTSTRPRPDLSEYLMYLNHTECRNIYHRVHTLHICVLMPALSKRSVIL